MEKLNIATNSSSNIKHYLDLVRGNKGCCCFFLGSGISIASPSNLPSGALLRDTILDNLCSKVNGLTESRNLLNEEQLNPELVYQVIVDNVGNFQEFLKTHTFCKITDFNANHCCIASLAIRGVTNTILTTNFDRLIEEALISQSKSEKQDFIIYKNDEDFDKYPIPGYNIHLIKIHGSIEDEHSMVVTLRQSGKGLSPSKTNLIKKIMSKMHLIFVGYSGYDIDIYPVLHEFNCNGMTWLVRPGSNNSRVISLVKSDPLKNSILECDLNDFFKEIAKDWHVPLTIPKNTNGTNLDLNQIANEWLKSIHPTQTLLSIGRLLYHSAYYKQALECWERASDLGIQLQRLSSVIAAKVNIATYYAENSETERALDILNESLSIANACSNKLAIGIIKGNIAILEAKNNYYSTSHPNFIDAREYYYKLEKPIEEARVLCNQASILCNSRKYEDAKNLFNEALVIFKREGELAGVSFCLNGLGVIADKVGMLSLAIEYFEKGMKIREEISDKIGMAYSLTNLGMSYAKSRQYAKSIESLKKACSIFNDLGDSKGIEKTCLWLDIALNKDYGELGICERFISSIKNKLKKIVK